MLLKIRVINKLLRQSVFCLLIVLSRHLFSIRSHILLNSNNVLIINDCHPYIINLTILIKLILCIVKYNIIINSFEYHLYEFEVELLISLTL